MKYDRGILLITLCTIALTLSSLLFSCSYIMTSGSQTPEQRAARICLGAQATLSMAQVALAQPTLDKDLLIYWTGAKASSELAIQIYCPQQGDLNGRSGE